MVAVKISVNWAHLSGILLKWWPCALHNDIKSVLYLLIKTEKHMTGSQIILNMWQQLGYLILCIFSFSFPFCWCHLHNLGLFFSQDFVVVLHWLPAVVGHMLLFHLLPNAVSPGLCLVCVNVIKNGVIFFSCVRKPACLQFWKINKNCLREVKNRCFFLLRAS